MLGSVGMTAGLAAGALLAGLAIEFTAEANTIIFAVLGIVTVLGIVVVALSPESGTRTPGAWRSLIPRVSVSPAARREFAAAAPVIAAIWMLAGLSLGLAPTIVRSVFQLDSGLVNGLSGFIAPAIAAVVAVAFGRLSPRRGMALGILASIAGTLGIVTGVLAGSLALMITGLVITGIGFGAAFSGSLRLIMPLAGPQQRAGTVAAIYVIAYIAFGLPVIIAGQLAVPLGLVPAVAGYGAATVMLALISLVAQYRISRGRRG